MERDRSPASECKLRAHVVNKLLYVKLLGRILRSPRGGSDNRIISSNIACARNGASWTPTVLAHACITVVQLKEHGLTESSVALRLYMCRNNFSARIAESFVPILAKQLNRIVYVTEVGLQSHLRA